MSTPSWLPFRNVINVGDIVILLGVFVLLHVTCASRLGLLVRRHRLDPVCLDTTPAVLPESGFTQLPGC